MTEREKLQAALDASTAEWRRVHRPGRYEGEQIRAEAEWHRDYFALREYDLAAASLSPERAP